MSGGRRNSAAEEHLALHLANGLTVQAAAESAGVSEATAHRRLKEPEFVRRVHEIRRGLIGRASGLLASRLSAATDALADLLASPDGKLRLGAARAIIEAAFRARQMLDLEDFQAEMHQRIAKVEEDLANRDSGQDARASFHAGPEPTIPWEQPDANGLHPWDRDYRPPPAPASSPPAGDVGPPQPPG